MRSKIFGIFAIIVALVSALSFALMRASLGELSDAGEAERAVTAAVAQLRVEGLAIERWLAQESAADSARTPFEAGSATARSEAATTLANSIQERSRSASPFLNVKPGLIVVFDKAGIVLGRNQSGLMRGENLGERHPAMMKAILAATTSSEVWVDQARDEQLLASYAPVRGSEGEVIGGIAIGTPFNNERLQQVSDATSELALFAAVPDKDGMRRLAQSGSVSELMTPAVAVSKQALGSDQVVNLAGLSEDLQAAARGLSGYGDGGQAVVVAVNMAPEVGTLRSMLLPFIGVVALGLLLTAVAAHLLDRYVSQPISDLEEGLLAVINGEREVRFELEHAMLGGLVFRVNSLLNELLGVEEDTTDEDGRLASTPPSSSRFTAALNVDERMVSLSLDDVADGATLRDEVSEDYYKRIYDEYLAGLKALGDPTDHVRFADFSKRIKDSERGLAERHGKPFRYTIERKGGEIIFVAVPLA